MWMERKVLTYIRIDVMPLEAIEHIQHKVWRLPSVVICMVPAPQLLAYSLCFFHAFGRCTRAIWKAVGVRKQRPSHTIVR